MAETSTMLPLGTLAPDFELPDPHGTALTRDAVRGEKGLLVAFVCNHCPYVHHIADVFGELTSAWMRRGLGVVGINANDVAAYPDDAPPKMLEAASEWGWQFPYLYDESQGVARSYHAACTPDLFLFDAELRLVYRGQFDSSRPSLDSPVTGADLAAAVEALLAGEPVPEDQKPSMGCGIKWKPGSEPG